MSVKPDKPLLVWAIILSQFGPPFMFSGVAVALPELGADLNAGATSLSLVETIFLAGSLSFLLPVGRLADSGDKNSLYKLGLLGFGVASIVIASLSWMPGLLFVRFLQGIFSALFAATGTAVLADIVPAEKRGRAFGLSMAVVYVGLTLGPVLAGFLVHAWGWRSVFLVGGGVIFAGLILVHRMLPSKWERPSKVLHWPSTALIVIAVMCLVGGSATLSVGALGYLLMSLGLVLVGLFVRMQKRVDNPLVDVNALLKNLTLRDALAVQMLLYTNAFCSIFMLSLFVQIVLGYSAPVAGQILAVATLVTAFVAPFAGGLADRMPPGSVTTAGIGCMLVSGSLAAMLGSDSGLLAVAVMLAIQGLGFALFTAPNMSTIMNSVSGRQSGMASALGAKSRSIGMMTGMLITAVLISIQVGNDPIEAQPDKFVWIMRTCFSILIALSAIAFAICILGLRRHHNPHT